MIPGVFIFELESLYCIFQWSDISSDGWSGDIESFVQSYEAFPVEDASGGTITFSIGGPQAAFQQILQDLLN